MTKAQKFLKRFPNSEPNSNVLVDIACPQCGQREVFKIAYSTFGIFIDAGEEEQDGDQEWLRSIACKSGECDHSGTLREFTHRGLDDLIEQRKLERSRK